MLWHRTAEAWKVEASSQNKIIITRKLSKITGKTINQATGGICSWLCYKNYLRSWAHLRVGLRRRGSRVVTASLEKQHRPGLGRAGKAFPAPPIQTPNLSHGTMEAVGFNPQPVCWPGTRLGSSVPPFYCFFQLSVSSSPSMGGSR